MVVVMMLVIVNLLYLLEKGGKYLFTVQFEIDTIDDGERVELKVYKNGSEDNRARQFQYTGFDSGEHFIHNSFY